MAEFILIPLVGAFIGWLTNWVAVKMLFRPYRPFRIPLLNLTFQGVIPKRQAEIARVVGQVVEEELLSVDDIIHRLEEQDLLQKLQDSVSQVIRTKLQKKIPNFLPAALKNIITEIIKDRKSVV